MKQYIQFSNEEVANRFDQFAKGCDYPESIENFGSRIFGIYDVEEQDARESDIIDFMDLLGINEHEFKFVSERDAAYAKATANSCND